MKNLILVLTTATLFSCNCTKKTTTALIKDCPDEKIINRMPTVGDNKTSNEYYIYKGERKEIKDFDANWVTKNCNVKVSTVY